MSDEFVRGLMAGLFLAVILREIGDMVRRRWKIVRREETK